MLQVLAFYWTSVWRFYTLFFMAHSPSRTFLRFSSPLPRHTPLLLSPWLFVGAAVVLGLAIAFWAVKNTQREQENTARNLVERAGALMWAMEGSARAGMGMHSTASYLQYMMEETAKQADIIYMAVITRDGYILAHSDRLRIGGQLHPDDGMSGIIPFNHISWRVIKTVDDERVFEAYRYFKPLSGFRDKAGHRRMMSGSRHARHAEPFREMMPRGPMLPSANFLPPPAGLVPPPPSQAAPDADSSPQEEGDLLIIIGLDMASYDSALVAGQRSTLFTALLVGLLGAGGFISLYWAQSYKLSRRLLLDTRAYAEEVMNSLPLGLVIVDPSGKVGQVNGPAERLLGRESGELLGRSLDETQGKSWRALAARVDAGEAVLEEEHSLGTASGKAVPVSISASRVLNEEGRSLGRLFLLRDLREVKRLQAELRRSERLSTLGNMAARVAHEIRNPLSSIKGFATYLGTCCGSPESGSPDMEEAARTMIGEVDRLNRVVSEMLDFARPAHLATSPTELGELMRRGLRLVAMDAESKGVVLRLDESCPGNGKGLFVAVDGERITQALLNLLLNAVQATDSGGTVSLGALPPEEGLAGLTVSDTGRGMEPEVLAQVFNPYYTTRTTGTGLGLSIVSRIIDDHQGEISIESKPGAGTTVTVRLPLAEAGISENCEEGAAASAPHSPPDLESGL